MKIKLYAPVALAAMLCMGTLQAQSLPEPMLEAVRKAVTTNPEVQARWFNFTAAQAERDAVSANWRPQVDLTYGIGRENNRTPLGGALCRSLWKLTSQQTWR